MKIKTIGYLFLVVSLLTGALVPVVLAMSTESNLIEFFLLAYLLGIPVAALLLFATKRQGELASYLREPKKLGLMGFIGILTYMSFEVAVLYAVRHIGAALTTVVFRTSPLIMLILIPVILREKLTKNQIIALCLGFVGIYLAFTGGQIFSVFSSSNLPILLLLLLAASAYALASLLMKKYIFDMPSEMLIFNVSLFFVFALAFFASGMAVSPLHLNDIGVILFIALDNVLGFYMYFHALRVLKTTVVTNVYFLSPFLTLIFASLLLGETILPYYVLIAALVTAGLVIQKFDKIGGTYLAKKPEKLRNFVIFDVSGAFSNTGEVAIANALNDGSRVMAVKLPAEHRKSVERRIRENGHTNVFTSDHKPIADEVSFVKDVMEADDSDLILMKVGSFDDGEEFFGDMADIIGNNPDFAFVAL